MSSGDSSTEREMRLRRILTETTELLDALPTEWVVVGALAAEQYRAAPRTTTDADLLVAWHRDLPIVLEDAGFEIRVSRDGGEVHLIRARRRDTAIDLIVAGTDYQMLAIERGRRAVLTIEDVLVHKVIAWRPKDRGDIRSILSTGHAFDLAYVDQWVREWGYEDRWSEAQTWR